MLRTTILAYVIALVGLVTIAMGMCARSLTIEQVIRAWP